MNLPPITYFVVLSFINPSELQQTLLPLMHIDHHSLEGIGSQAAISAYILDIASAK